MSLDIDVLHVAYCYAIRAEYHRYCTVGFRYFSSHRLLVNASVYLAPWLLLKVISTVFIMHELRRLVCRHLHYFYCIRCRRRPHRKVLGRPRRRGGELGHRLFIIMISGVDEAILL